ncbi:chemotaxis protein CheB [Ilyomonas limi]|uniref:protein-glutamate methylesterase n=1 Tax=Ilyomonas limi TaxID=2575867 RepID=A0A4U3KYE8_9BACT|nr:chemotaxis protein CheB [Ilyomonas limi]TKK67392.1 chemotaxis protein CheB [Ilyomonas limi]
MAQDEIKKVFVIGGSSGSFDVLLYLLARLQPLDAAAIVIVLHRKSGYDTALIEVFSYRTGITVKEVDEKEPMLPGFIYVAPANYHLLIEKDYTFSLDVSERINYSRPSIDVCFETAAEAFGQKLFGILLSGSNIDGTHGLETIRQFGGTTIVQNPQTAESPFMPQQAINNGAADYVLEPEGIARFINGE